MQGQSVSSGIAKFTNDLYLKLAEKEGNIIVSPFSAHAVLALLHQGATGKTADCLEKVLRLPSHEPAANDYKKIMGLLNAVKNITLVVANKIFVHNNLTLNDSFKSIASEYFSAEAETVDFTDAEVSVMKINGWIEDKTKNEIKNFMSPDALYTSTQFILINAVYFHGNWLKQFSKLKTRKAPFNVSKTKTEECDLMHFEEVYFDYIRNDKLDAEILKMPYTNKMFSFLVILPSKKSGIKNLESKLAKVDIGSLIKQLVSIEVEVFLPRFRIEMSIPLKQPLTEMGLSGVFQNAELSKMTTSTEKLACNDVLQKAIIDVYEEGTVAAAATAVRMLGCGLPQMKPPKPVFRADRPFIFAIVFNDEYPLFFGRIMKPEKSSFRFKSHDEELAEGMHENAKKTWKIGGPN